MSTVQLPAVKFGVETAARSSSAPGSAQGAGRDKDFARELRSRREAGAEDAAREADGTAAEPRRAEMPKAEKPDSVGNGEVVGKKQEKTGEKPAADAEEGVEVVVSATVAMTVAQQVAAAELVRQGEQEVPVAEGEAPREVGVAGEKGSVEELQMQAEAGAAMVTSLASGSAEQKLERDQGTPRMEQEKVGRMQAGQAESGQPQEGGEQGGGEGEAERKPMEAVRVAAEREVVENVGEKKAEVEPVRAEKREAPVVHAAGDRGAVASVVGGAKEAAAAASPAGLEERFLQANGPSVVSGVRGQLLPNGGTMTLRLEPPGVGVMQVALTMRDGAASVQFLTDNAETARLLTQTLGQLRDTLSVSGVAVDRMSVQQTPKSETSSNAGQDRGGTGGDARGGQQGAGAWGENGGQREQQRRDLLERMWRKVAGDDVNVWA
jgi:flagellar hook-length control protein FliK